MPTLEAIIDQGVKNSGRKMNYIADTLGVSNPTLFRIRKGMNKDNSPLEKGCVVGLVEQGIVEPQILPAYCRERCPIGMAREKYHLKK